ncbi:MAG: hypothetical protein ACOCP8_04970, partial [archaeon]
SSIEEIDKDEGGKISLGFLSHFKKHKNLLLMFFIIILVLLEISEGNFNKIFSEEIITMENIFFASFLGYFLHIIGDWFIGNKGEGLPIIYPIDEIYSILNEGKSNIRKFYPQIHIEKGSSSEAFIFSILFSVIIFSVFNYGMFINSVIINHIGDFVLEISFLVSLLMGIIAFIIFDPY